MDIARKIAILPADQTGVRSCLPILADSVLGDYFEPELAEDILRESQASGDLFIALRGERVVGFYAVAMTGAFLVFPYLHLLAVATEERGTGIGALLLDHFEARCLAAEGYPPRPKAFLLVAEENRRAIAFYERHGYERKAVFEDMFAEGDIELLYMKDLGPKPGMASRA